MLALQQMNWKKLETALKAQGMKINIEQIQQEIEKAMQQVDWKKLDDETSQAMDQANEQIEKMRNAYVVRVGNYQRDRTRQQERIKQAQQQILLERLQQRKLLQKLEEEKKKETTKPGKKKKIVVI
jgi:hypothetical protein